MEEIPMDSSETNTDNVESTEMEGYIDRKALQMMAKMGYKTGSGLGKNEQGRLEPVVLATQRGRYGLGSTINAETSEDRHEISIKEKLDWLEYTPSNNCLTGEILSYWLKKGCATAASSESHFCDPDIVSGLLKAKGIFDVYDPLELCKARARANPFETIRSMFFMNRAALKMANIDAVTDYMFTSIDTDPVHQKPKGPYYFADVCAGPGGFTEYILWRKHWMFKGFGFTLRGENDFKLSKSCCASGATFQPLYGSQGDGNICCPENIQDFKEKVLQGTHGEGVHFMMSDGGFSVEGNENMQEVLSKQIYVCQCLVALEIVRQHGHFVTKLFDIFTPFSVGLVYLMRRCFKRVCILKPNTSRPANSERYFICQDRLKSSEVTAITMFLRKIVNELWFMRSIDNNPDLDVTEIVPVEVMKNDETFFNYIKNSNDRIGRSQINALNKIGTYCQNLYLVDSRQAEIKKKCLQQWFIPIRSKLAPAAPNINDFLNQFLQDSDFMLVPPKEIFTLTDFNTSIDASDYHFCFLFSGSYHNTCTLYAGVGDGITYKLDRNKWRRVKNLHLAVGTCLLGELIKENVKFKTTDPLQPEKECEKYSLHVIDALRLGNVSLADLPLQERLDLIDTFCESVNYECNPKRIRVRPKVVKPLLHFSIDNEPSLKEHTLILPVLGISCIEERYTFNSVLLLKTSTQMFKSMYVLRVQVFLDDAISMKSFEHFIKSDAI